MVINVCGFSGEQAVAKPIVSANRHLFETDDIVINKFDPHLQTRNKMACRLVKLGSLSIESLFVNSLNFSKKIQITYLSF